MSIDDALYGRQAHSCAGEISIVVQALKGPEQLTRILHVKPCAVVAHKVDFLPLLLLHAQFDHRLRFAAGKLPSLSLLVHFGAALLQDGLAETIDRAQWRTQVMGYGVTEGFKLAIARQKFRL